MVSTKPTLSAYVALFSILATWLYPVCHLPANWTHFTSAAVVTLALAVLGLASLIVLLRRKRTWAQLSPIVLAVACSLVLCFIAHTICLPVQLISVGAVFMGAWRGPLEGATAGVATALASAFISPSFIAYTSVYAFLGMFAGVLALLGVFRNGLLAAGIGVFAGFPAALLAAPMNAMVAGGLVSELQMDIALQTRNGKDLFPAVLDSSIFHTPLDIGCVFLIVWAMLCLVDVVRPACTAKHDRVAA